MTTLPLFFLFLDSSKSFLSATLMCSSVFDHFVGLALKGLNSADDRISSIDLFQSNVSFLYPPQNIRKLVLFWYLQGVLKRSISLKWFNISTVDTNLVKIYLFKVINTNTRKSCELCSKLSIKTPECRSGVFVVNFEHSSQLFQVLLLLTLNK